MLASLFLVMGAQTLKNPQVVAERARPVIEKLQPLLHKVAPDRVSGHIPDEPVTFVRVNSVVQIAGGLMLATGRGRRLGAALLAGSLVPTTMAGHAFWSVKDDPDARRTQITQFLKNVSIFGGLILASRDTEGQPSLGWQAQHGIESARKAGDRTLRTARREAKLVARAGRSELPF